MRPRPPGRPLNHGRAGPWRPPAMPGERDCAPSCLPASHPLGAAPLSSSLLSPCGARLSPSACLCPFASRTPAPAAISPHPVPDYTSVLLFLSTPSSLWALSSHVSLLSISLSPPLAPFAPRSRRVLSSMTRNPAGTPCRPAVGSRSLSPWTTGEVPSQSLSFRFFVSVAFPSLSLSLSLSVPRPALLSAPPSDPSVHPSPVSPSISLSPRFSLRLSPSLPASPRLSPSSL